MGHVTVTTPHLRHQYVALDIAYLCTKYGHYSFSRSRDMVGAHENLNGSLSSLG